MTTKPLAGALLLALLAPAEPARAMTLRLEAGGYRTVSNRFNIPNPGGSRISLADSQLRPYARLEAKVPVSERGSLRLLFAPLRSSYTFIPAASSTYLDLTVPGGSRADVTYVFNSYRLSYLYRFVDRDDAYVQAGAVAKIRQASIAVSGVNGSRSYDNVGFVPLLNVGAGIRVARPLFLRFDLDGAAAKQGRAFDGSLEAFVPTASGTEEGISAGIRVLEGGADNSKVNTFALFQYAFVAFTKAF